MFQILAFRFNPVKSDIRFSKLKQKSAGDISPARNLFSKQRTIMLEPDPGQRKIIVAFCPNLIYTILKYMVQRHPCRNGLARHGRYTREWGPNPRI